jgi:hypothetical protein
MITSYHPFSAKVVTSTMEQYYIGKLVGGSEFGQVREGVSSHFVCHFLIFCVSACCCFSPFSSFIFFNAVRFVVQYLPDSGLYATLRERVRDYFVSTGKDHKDPTPGLLNLVFFLGVAFLMFTWAHASQSFSLPWRYAMAAVFGVFQALPLLHCMHDCSHSSLSHKPWLWRLVGHLTFDFFAGGSINSWHHQHVVGHHLYTNVLGADPDLPVKIEGTVFLRELAL